MGKSTQWAERVLWSFGATSDDGQTPGFQAALLADKSGNLYGTTTEGGANACPQNGKPGCGAVFELSPPYGKSTQWSERVLYSFAGGPMTVPVSYRQPHCRQGGQSLRHHLYSTGRTMQG